MKVFYILKIKSGISGSHDGKYEDGCLLGSCTVVLYKLTYISEVLAVSIIRAVITMMLETPL
jgi:hypothetical protein